MPPSTLRAVRCVPTLAFAALAVTCIPTGSEEPDPQPVVTPGEHVPRIGGGSYPIPEQCRIAPPRTAVPYTTTFQVRNATDKTVYFRDLCAPEFVISSCASGYTDDLTQRGSSGCSCELGGQCPVGGPCRSTSGGEILAGGTAMLSWVGYAHVKSSVGGVDCNQPVPVPPGFYEMRLNLFADTAAATAGAPIARTLKQVFELGPGRLVEVLIQP